MMLFDSVVGSLFKTTVDLLTILVKIDRKDYSELDLDVFQLQKTVNLLDGLDLNDKEREQYSKTISPLYRVAIDKLEQEYLQYLLENSAKSTLVTDWFGIYKFRKNLLTGLNHTISLYDLINKLVIRNYFSKEFAEQEQKRLISLGRSIGEESRVVRERMLSTIQALVALVALIISVVAIIVSTLLK